MNDYEHMLNNLLAVIHRDGGHYTGKHGVQKSAEDAMKIVAEMYADKEAASESNRRTAREHEDHSGPY